MRACLTLIACAIVLAACGKGKNEQESSGDVAPPANAAAAPAMPVTQASWAPDALDELVAPIALYPDQLVGQILAASVNTQEVLDVGNWLLQNENLKGATLDTAAQKAGFGPAARGLVQFPTVVDMMCQEIDWTRQLGAAFTSDQKAVLDAVQRMRAQAADVGNLKSTPQQTVERKTEEGKEIVEVKPADPKVVYVPQYDPTIIYTTPPPATPAPAPVPQPQESTVSTSSAVGGALLAFGVGVLIGSAIDNDDYCYPHWGGGAVYYGPRPFYPPAYVYRPVYGPAFRPAYGYAPPAGYRNRYNSPTNIVINNNNYYNRFSNNQNLRVNNRNTGVGNNRQAGAGNRGQADNWKGQKTYAGARPNAGNDRRPTTNDRRAPTTADRRTATPDRRAATAQRPNQPSQQRSTARSSSPSRQADRPNAQAADSRRDRGYGSPSSADRPAAAASPRAAQTASSPSRDRQPREHALSGASGQNTGSFDRSASARGHASTSSGRQQQARGGRRP